MTLILNSHTIPNRFYLFISYFFVSKIVKYKTEKCFHVDKGISEVFKCMLFKFGKIKSKIIYLTQLQMKHQNKIS